MTNTKQNKINKSEFKTIAQVWEAIDIGITVYWANESYELTIEPMNLEYRLSQGWAPLFSARGDKSLRVTCMNNWFGCTLIECQLSELFTTEEK